MNTALTEVLLVEDDADLCREVKEQFRQQGLNVDVAVNCPAAEQMIDNKHYDIALVDVNLAGCRGPRCGYDFVKYVRTKQIDMPVIMLTALGEIEDKLEGFSAGADDYITKPFYFQELKARIHAILNRSGSNAANITIADMVIDTRRREVQRKGNTIRLTSREYEILLMLAEAKGEPISKQALLVKVWGISYSANTNTIEVFMNLLRNKIDKNIEPKLIRTRVGAGYYIGTR